MSDEQIKSLLLVEDEKQYGEIVAQLHAVVAKTFYDECLLSVVPTWDEALARVESNRPDALVLDLTLLPAMRPDDTLLALRRTWKALPPVVVLTGSDDKLMRRKAILAGAESFQSKQEFNRHPEQLCEKIYEAFLRRLRNAGS